MQQITQSLLQMLKVCNVQISHITHARKMTMHYGLKQFEMVGRRLNLTISCKEGTSVSSPILEIVLWELKRYHKIQNVGLWVMIPSIFTCDVTT
jgi:hypothetical protein